MKSGHVNTNQVLKFKFPNYHEIETNLRIPLKFSQDRNMAANAC